MLRSHQFRNSVDLCSCLAATFFLACGRPGGDLSGLSSGSQGAHVDNGGDEILCVEDPVLAASGKPYFRPGTYTLDYVLTFDPKVGTDHDAVGDWPTLRRRLVRTIETKLPELAPSFRDYLAALDSSNPVGDRVWNATDLSLIDLPDEDIDPTNFQTVPDNCKILKEGKLVPNLTQLVRRRHIVNADIPRVFYNYDYKRMGAFRTDHPLQYAYIILHEWLWDFADDAWINRSINRLLQDTSVDSLTSEEVHRAVRAFGVTGDEGGFLGTEGPKVAAMRQYFESNPLCQYGRRATAEFFADVGRIAIAPGESVTSDLVVPDLQPVLGKTTCGFALLMSYRGRGGSATLDVKLERGVGSFPMTMTAHDGGLGQALFTAKCQDALCIARDGDLEELLTYRSFGLSRWKLTIRNRATSPVRAEVVLPYFVFVKMKD